MSPMGMQRGVNTVATNNEVSVTTWASYKLFSIQYDDDDRISSIEISKISTRNCHVSSNISTNHDGEIKYNNHIVNDSHVDTHYFGKNFWIVSSTDLVFSVNALIKDLEIINNVATVTATTTMIDEDGAVFIEVFGQGIGCTTKNGKVNNKYQSM